MAGPWEKYATPAAASAAPAAPDATAAPKMPWEKYGMPVKPDDWWHHLPSSPEDTLPAEMFQGEKQQQIARDANAKISGSGVAASVLPMAAAVGMPAAVSSAVPYLSGGGAAALNPVDQAILARLAGSAPGVISQTAQKAPLLPPGAAKLLKYLGAAGAVGAGEQIGERIGLPKDLVHDVGLPFFFKMTGH